MIRFKYACWVAVGIAVLAGPSVASSQATPPASADEAAIRAQAASWERAYNGGDAKAVGAQYAEDALLLPPGPPAVSGRPAIVEFFVKDIAGSKAAGAVFVLDLGGRPSQGVAHDAFSIVIVATRRGSM